MPNNISPISLPSNFPFPTASANNAPQQQRRRLNDEQKQQLVQFCIICNKDGKFSDNMVAEEANRKLNFSVTPSNVKTAMREVRQQTTPIPVMESSELTGPLRDNLAALEQSRYGQNPAPQLQPMPALEPLYPMEHNMPAPLTSSSVFQQASSHDIFGGASSFSQPADSARRGPMLREFPPLMPFAPEADYIPAPISFASVFQLGSSHDAYSSQSQYGESSTPFAESQSPYGDRTLNVSIPPRNQEEELSMVYGLDLDARFTERQAEDMVSFLIRGENKGLDARSAAKKASKEFGIKVKPSEIDVIREKLGLPIIKTQAELNFRKGPFDLGAGPSWR